MLEQITWKQFLEWEAFAQLEPYDEERADIRAAQIVTTLANINRDRKKRRTAYKISDFLLRFGDSANEKRSTHQKSWQQMKAISKTLAASFSSGVVTRRRKKR